MNSGKTELPEIIRNAESRRFEMHMEGQVAVIDYRIEGQRLILPHVGVPPALEGRGIAGALTKTALDWARDKSMSIVPICPYVVAWLKRHPEYADLVTAK